MRRTMGLRLVVHRLVAHRRPWRPLHLVRWSRGLRNPIRASKGTMLRSRADRQQPSSCRRQPPAQGWFGVRLPTVLLWVQPAALLAPQRVLPERCQQEARKVDRRGAHREGPRVDLWEGHLEVQMVVLWEGRSADRRGDRSVGHWAAPWWVRARERTVLMSPQRVKVVQCHQTLRRACYRVGFVQLRHGTVLQKFSVSPCIHPYRPHGAA